MTASSEDALSKLHAEVTNSKPAVSVPWTITNKYYTADVHFELRPLDGFAGYLASEVPAVVYVWNHGETYKTAVPELAQKLEHYDPEVSLAVRFNPAASSSVATTALPADDGEHGDEQALDEFISSHGFEYIDGDRGSRRPTQDGSSFSDEEDGGELQCPERRTLAHDPAAGVPGLPRVVDALSTIMWPSLVQSARTTQRKSRGGALLDWAAIEDAGGGDAPLLKQLSASQAEEQQRMQKEMDALENWLQEGLDQTQGRAAPVKHDRNDPWSTALSHSAAQDEDFDHDDGSAFGFEDDFDEFVGAPMDVTYGPERRTASSSSSAPPRGFTTDFVPFSSTVEKDVLGGFDDNDPDLPSHVEIEEMSKRLFGSASLAPPSTAHTWHRLHSPLHGGSADLPDSGIGGESGFSQSGADGLADDDDFEFGAFDLSKVLGALQGAKEEIAGMEDEDERRRAAARVALGLVYGLRKEEEREREAEAV